MINVYMSKLKNEHFACNTGGYIINVYIISLMASNFQGEEQRTETDIERRCLLRWFEVSPDVEGRACNVFIPFVTCRNEIRHMSWAFSL